MSKTNFIPGGLSMAQNRTTTSDNPLLINRLAQAPAGGLPTNRTDEAAPQVRQSHHYHQRSLQRDPELERALEEGGTPETLDNQTLQRASLEDSKASSS